MKANLLVSAGAASAAIPTVHMPINFKYGADSKISTDLKLPYSDTTIEVCYDLGSSDFWMFHPNAIQNWGANCLSCQGQCNRTVPDSGVYDPSKSSSASEVGPWDALYGYGGGLAKGYRTDGVVNDTFTFGNEAGYSTVVPDVQVALAFYLQQRIKDPKGECDPVPKYDFSIMGISPYYTSPKPNIENTTGPSFRQNLLQQGLVANTVQSLWFEKAPAKLEDTYTGSGLQGGIDLSKFTGPLVKIPSIPATDISYGAAGYYTYQPNLTFVADGAHVDLPVDRSGRAIDNECIIDSGAVSDGFAPIDQARFLNVTGLAYNPKRPDPGQMLSWPGACDTIPTDGEQAFLQYSFASVDGKSSIEIDMPLRSYARQQLPEDVEIGWCTMRMYLGSCLLAAPFSTRAFFAADDARLELALAKGGVAERGSGVDYSQVVDRIP
ncbi:Eukaryotic aspartyl protease [Apiospora kogelbergensis]|uniref:Eukaryotic aspartyl protease n=1 Tax=Apiospora kogelbergensis TaxID=1337665 RepID=UPI00313166B6